MPTPLDTTETTAADNAVDEVIDADVREILERGEAGIVDLVASYERVESIYLAAAAASAPAPPATSYSTHT